MMTWLGRGRFRSGKSYMPAGDLPAGQFEVTGQDIALASRNYNEATLGWMMSAGLFQQIRIDRDDHLLELVSTDWNTIANRAERHRSEPVYRVAMQLRVGVGGILTARSLFTMLSSDFDRMVAGWRLRESGKDLVQEVRREMSRGGVSGGGEPLEGQLWREVGRIGPDTMLLGRVDAHGRGVDR